MKAIVIALAAMASVGASAATFETTTNTCEGLRQAIKRNGWQYLTINGQPKMPHYNVYYADDSWCSSGQNGVTAWVPTADAKNCPVGIVCVDKNY